MRRHTGPLVLAALAIQVAGCSDDKPTVTQPPAPVPGVLTLSLATPNADDRAVMISVSGPGPIGETTASGEGYVLHSRVNSTGFRAAVFGNLVSGALLRFAVPDLNKTGSYQAAILEVSDAGNSLRSSTTGYSITITR
jgi:hypothetical protein